MERAKSEAEARRHRLMYGKQRPKPGRPKQVATDPGSVDAMKAAAEEAVTRYDQASYVLSR